MALIYPQWSWGWRVTAGSNDTLDFEDNSVGTSGAPLSAKLNAGTYCPDELAAEVQRAMRAVDAATPTCTYSIANKQFTLSGTATFSLFFGTEHNGNTCAALLGFTAGGGAGNDKTGSASYTGSALTNSGQTGTAPSLWTATDPLIEFSPVGAPAGTLPAASATLLQREILAVQTKTDGGNLETIYFAQFRKWKVKHGQLVASPDQTAMEALLDWAVTGGRVMCQPDKTATAALRLVLELQTSIADSFSWLTRAEVDYGDLVWIQQLTGS
jgi:hypothetical protein